MGEAVALRGDDLGQRRPDGYEVGHLPIHLGDLVQGPLLQVRAAVRAPAGLEQVHDLVEGETEPLRRLDGADQRNGVGRVGAVPTDAALPVGRAAQPWPILRQYSKARSLFSGNTTAGSAS